VVEAPLPPPRPDFPAGCEGGPVEGVCAPDGAFADRLCKAQIADAALVLFAKGSPWTRGYLTRDTEAWNASGGGSVRGKLLFDEEVLVLRKRAAGGIVVGQGGGYDVLRWDGTCASLAAEELTLRRPPRVRAAPIGWRNLNTPARDALLADAKLSALYDKRRKECKGATSGDVSAACVKADAALDGGIVAFVRDGGAVPQPRLP
jgi:hypothetical protein